jgi:hypothetical protein
MKKTIEEFRRRFCELCDEKECKRKFHKMAKCASVIIATEKAQDWLKK